MDSFSTEYLKFHFLSRKIFVKPWKPKKIISKLNILISLQLEEKKKSFVELIETKPWKAGSTATSVLFLKRGYTMDHGKLIFPLNEQGMYSLLVDSD